MYRVLSKVEFGMFFKLVSVDINICFSVAVLGFAMTYGFRE